MKIFLSPQIPINPANRIKYTLKEDYVQVEMPDGSTDTFDFRGLPDGVLDPEGIETILTPNPIVEARRDGGTLYIKLLNYIGMDATEEERFPTWIDHTEYVAPDTYKEQRPSYEEVEEVPETRLPETKTPENLAEDTGHITIPLGEEADISKIMETFLATGSLPQDLVETSDRVTLTSDSANSEVT